MSTLFKMPGGRSIPMQRAIAMGLADADGKPSASLAVDSRGAALIAKDKRREEWARKQADKPKRRVAPRVPTGGTDADDPQTTADGKIRRKREPKPLVPQNVTPEGEPITDEETLAMIAERTAAIEVARAAEEAAAEDAS